MITLIKTTQLTSGQLDQLELLCQRSEKKEGFRTHFYWNAMSDRPGDFFSDFLLYINQELVACVSLFLFEEDAVEICALTHPDHRKKGYFYRLFSEAQMEIFNLELKYCLFCCPKNSAYAKRLFERVNATYQSSEIQLIMTRECHALLGSKNKSESPEKISLKKAQLTDAKTLAYLGSQCFSTHETSELERMVQILSEKKRSAFMAIYQNKIIGKTHCIKSSQTNITLHDFCLLPEFQNQGLAMALLEKILAHFFRYNCENIRIHASSNQQAALKLYKKIGFQEAETIEYWRLNISPDSESANALDDFDMSATSFNRHVLH